MTTGYEPLLTLKPVTDDIWIADGPVIRFYGLPFPTRMTVVRLCDGGVFVHSPVPLEGELRAQVDAVGPVRHLVAPNWIHYAWIPAWQAAFPDAETWGCPGVQARARTRGVGLHLDHLLGESSPDAWADEIEQRLVVGGVHSEVVFFHRRGRTLILTDLIENFELPKVPWYFRPLVRLGGVADPDGKTPADLRAMLSTQPDALRAHVDAMLAWDPERVILAHGRWYTERGTDELRRAFRWVKR